MDQRDVMAWHVATESGEMMTASK